MSPWWQNVVFNPWNLWRFIFISFGDLSPRLWSRCLTLCISCLTFSAFLLFRHALVCSASFHPMKPHVALHNYDAKPNAGTPGPSRVTCPMRVSRRNGFVFLHSWVWWHFVMMLVRMCACITDSKQRTSSKPSAWGNIYVPSMYHSSETCPNCVHFMFLMDDCLCLFCLAHIRAICIRGKFSCFCLSSEGQALECPTINSAEYLKNLV